MKKTIIAISALIVLLSSSEMHELLRLPFLYTHYTKHRQKDPSLTFIGFLKIHYNNNHPADNDDEDDSKLPFSSQKEIIQTYITGLPAAITAEEHCFCISSNKPAITGPEALASQKGHDIFHPPQLLPV